MAPRIKWRQQWVAVAAHVTCALLQLTAEAHSPDKSRPWNPTVILPLPTPVTPPHAQTEASSRGMTDGSKSAGLAHNTMLWMLLIGP